MNRLIESAEKVRMWIQTIRDNSHKISLLLTFGCFLFLLLGAFDEVARAQSGDVTIPNGENWEEFQNKVEGMSGDPDANMQTLNNADVGSSLLNWDAEFFGTDSFGAEAIERGEKLGLSEFTRKGAIAVVDQNVHIMAANPPGVNIPGHLANEWLPGRGTDSVSVYAQTDGYDFLTTTLGMEPLWAMFRNLAYSGFVIIIMVAGFMIMFRSKINGQVAVNIINTIPGIVVGLIMVTFSLAIVGLIIDFSRLLTWIISDFMSHLPGGFTTQSLGGPLEMAKDAFMALGGPGLLVGGVISLVLLFTPGAIVGILGLLLVLIVGAIALYAAVRVYITLITAYIRIIMDLLLGPIYILLGSLPGKSMMIVDWLKRIVSAALVFPVVFFIINMARYIGQSNINTGLGGPMQFMTGGDASQPLFQIRGIFVIALYFFAAGAPSIINDILAVTESKGTQTALESTKKAVGKIPLVGGFFG